MMGLMDKLRGNGGSEVSRTGEINVRVERTPEFKDLDPKSKAVLLLQAVDENISRITQNQHMLETEYLPKLSGFTRTLGGEFDPNNVDSALFYDKLLQQWTERQVTLQKVMTRINHEINRETVAKNEIAKLKQAELALLHEKKQRDEYILAGRIQQVTDQRDIEKDPVADRKFVHRVVHSMGRGAMVRLGNEVGEHRARCNEIEDTLIPTIRVDIQERVVIIDDVRMNKNQLSDRLDTLKLSFDDLYRQQVTLMERFNEELRGLHGMINRTNNGMLAPSAVDYRDDLRQITSRSLPTARGMITAEISHSEQETVSNRSFLTDTRYDEPEYTRE